MTTVGAMTTGFRDVVLEFGVECGSSVDEDDEDNDWISAVGAGPGPEVELTRLATRPATREDGEDPAAEFEQPAARSGSGRRDSRRGHFVASLVLTALVMLYAIFLAVFHSPAVNLFRAILVGPNSKLDILQLFHVTQVISVITGILCAVIFILGFLRLAELTCGAAAFERRARRLFKDGLRGNTPARPADLSHHMCGCKLLGKLTRLISWYDRLFAIGKPFFPHASTGPTFVTVFLQLCMLHVHGENGVNLSGLVIFATVIWFKSLIPLLLAIDFHGRFYIYVIVDIAIGLFFSVFAWFYAFVVFMSSITTGALGSKSWWEPESRVTYVQTIGQLLATLSSSFFGAPTILEFVVNVATQLLPLALVLTRLRDLQICGVMLEDVHLRGHFLSSSQGSEQADPRGGPERPASLDMKLGGRPSTFTLIKHNTCTKCVLVTMSLLVVLSTAFSIVALEGMLSAPCPGSTPAGEFCTTVARPAFHRLMNTKQRGKCPCIVFTAVNQSNATRVTRGLESVVHLRTAIVLNTPLITLPALPETTMWLYTSNAELVDLSSLASKTYGQLMFLVSLSNPRLRNISSVGTLPSINWLELSSNPSLADIGPLQGAASLSTLALKSNVIRDVAPLQSLNSLRTLDLVDNQISDLAPLASLGLLADLRVSMNSLSSLEWAARLANLDTLFIGGNNITDITPLQGLTKLGLLGLAENRDLVNISGLAGLRMLRMLWLSFTSVSDVSDLAQLPNLVDLMVASSQLDAAPAGLATQFPKLKHLDIGNNARVETLPIVDAPRSGFEIHADGTSICGAHQGAPSPARSFEWVNCTTRCDPHCPPAFHGTGICSGHDLVMTCDVEVCGWDGGDCVES